MYIFTSLFILKAFATKEEIEKDKKEILNKISNFFSKSNYESSEIKKKIDILAALQMANIYVQVDTTRMQIEEAKKRGFSIPNMVIEACKVEKNITDLLKKFLQGLKITNVPERLENIHTEISKIFTDQENDSDYVNRHFNAMFNDLDSFLRGQVDLNQAYTNCQEQVSTITDINKSKFEELERKLEKLKFLTEKEYGSQDNLSKVIKVISEE